MDREQRELLKQEISRIRLSNIPRDSKGRIIPEEDYRAVSSIPGDWIPVMKGRKCAISSHI